MTLEALIALFDDDGNQDEFLRFERVKERYSQRMDLHAFILLDRLLPGSSQDIVAGAEHDEIYLGIDAEKLAAVLTHDRAIELIRCGVRWDSQGDGLAMFA